MHSVHVQEHLLLGHIGPNLTVKPIIPVLHLIAEFNPSIFFILLLPKGVDLVGGAP